MLNDPARAIPEVGPLVGYRSQGPGAVVVAVPDNEHRQHQTARGPRQFGRRVAREEGPAEQFHRHLGGRRRPVQQEGDDAAGLQPLDYFEEGEGIAADHKRINPQARPGGPADFGQAVLRLRRGEDEWADSALLQQD